jgi:DNA-binding MarR family transcriptional regulator
VSQAVARLRDTGAIETSVDPADRRRTLVMPATDRAARKERTADLEPIDELLAATLVERLGPDGADHLDEARAALEVLADLFIPDRARTHERELAPRA